MPPGEPLVVSATTYTTYLRCPEQARARVMGTYPEDSESSFRGILAHRVFARHLTDGAVDRDDFARVCREEIGKSLNPKMVSLRLKPSRVSAVVHEVQDLYERFSRFPSDGFEAAERQIVHEPAPGVTLRGVVDAVFAAADGSIRIVDWKTGHLGSAEPQLDFYALLWTLATGSAPAEVEAASVATGERFTARPDSKRLADTARVIAEMVGDLRAALGRGAECVKTAGPWCRHCPLLESCDEGRAAGLPG